MYIIGTEECERSIAQSTVNTSKKNWEDRLKSALGPLYIPISAHTLQVFNIKTKHLYTYTFNLLYL